MLVPQWQKGRFVLDRDEGVKGRRSDKYSRIADGRIENEWREHNYTEGRSVNAMRCVGATIGFTSGNEELKKRKNERPKSMNSERQATHTTNDATRTRYSTEEEEEGPLWDSPVVTVPATWWTGVGLSSTGL